jgi:DNA-binding PadR family transcriptional regulator
MRVPDDRQIAELERLEALYDAGGDTSELIPLEVLQQLVGDSQAVYPWLREMEAQGLVGLSKDLVPRARLSPVGVDRVSEARRRGSSRSERRTASRGRLLGWTDQHSNHSGDFVNALSFAGSPYGWYEGDRFQWHEVVAAADWLSEAGLITTQKLESSNGVSRVDVAITEAGHECIDEYDGNPAAYGSSNHRGDGPVARSGINKQAIAKMVNDIQQEFDKHPIRVPLEGDAPGVSGVGSTTIYNGPVIQGDANGVQLAWGNKSVSQTQNTAQQIAPGFEALAAAVAQTLRGLPDAGLLDEAQQDAEQVAKEILDEVTAVEPDRSRLKRAVTTLKGFLAPLALGLSEGAGEGSKDWAKTAVAQLTSSFDFSSALEL